MVLSRRDWLARAFALGAAASPIGRLRTALAAGEGARLRVVFASCQKYTQGYFAAWRRALANTPDLVLCLGDYVYESSWGRRLMRRYDADEPRQTFLARRAAAYRAYLEPMPLPWSLAPTGASMRGFGDAADRATGVRTLHRFEIRYGSGRLEA